MRLPRQMYEDMSHVIDLVASLLCTDFSQPLVRAVCDFSQLLVRALYDFSQSVVCAVCDFSQSVVCAVSQSCVLCVIFTHSPASNSVSVNSVVALLTVFKLSIYLKCT
jgi:hypothetical protein